MEPTSFPVITEEVIEEINFERGQGWFVRFENSEEDILIWPTPPYSPHVPPAKRGQGVIVTYAVKQKVPR